MTKLILLDSLLQEDKVHAPQGPSSISAVAELVSLFQANFVGKSGPQTFFERSAIFGSREVSQVSISMFWHAASPKTAF